MPLLHTRHHTSSSRPGDKDVIPGLPRRAPGEEAIPVVMDERDLRESFMRGGGPGGQSVNMAGNAVLLTHVPSGVIVRVHDTQSLQWNRKIARARLKEKLDWLINGRESKLGRKIAKIKKRNANKKRQTRKAQEEATSDSRDVDSSDDTTTVHIEDEELRVWLEAAGAIAADDDTPDTDGARGKGGSDGDGREGMSLRERMQRLLEED
ncbi:unnamed protein product [Vitrella brassicaformis CCMP3155]|uniref:Prokaryotic-type class I peptide chain release factors domain-containing protein n=1 Tax=Vitrella brassicaformis (strain CCMP3155) TaxID=1169540 RepID=A0A0G4EJG4_VITBC|nr:unnamed protein product [Vitrella brassicaformis CCMP3155]|eukprot:CEL96631.1 unnamed protein product [Vitrella brassicaformis CCMP3155]